MQLKNGPPPRVLPICIMKKWTPDPDVCSFFPNQLRSLFPYYGEVGVVMPPPKMILRRRNWKQRQNYKAADGGWKGRDARKPTGYKDIWHGEVICDATLRVGHTF